MLRTGSQYLAALKDGRKIYVDGKLVDDVTTYPGFAGPVGVMAGLYDRMADDPDARYTDPETGETYSRIWEPPSTPEALSSRRRNHERWATPSFGLMGRTPDHVSSLLTAFVGSRHLFARNGQKFADNLVRFYERARREDLYVSYAIVPPQVDRSKPAHQQPEPFLYPGVVEERPDGIVIRGAQMIGTSAVMADYILLTYVVPLQPGDEDYAISCVMPVNAEGVKLYPRRPYGEAATSTFDYPLSSRFDESDAMIVFDDVFVPWEEVFIYKDVALTREQFTHTGAHLLANYQALSRFCVKLRFACGLAMKLSELHGLDKLPPVRGQLGGGVATIASQIEGLVRAAELTPTKVGDIYIPDQRFIYTGMSLQRQLVTELLRWLRELAGGSLIAIPSSADSFSSAETADDVRRYFRSVAAPADERVQLLKTIWDFVGTEFAGRQLQYEMFYSAAQHICDARVFDSYDWDSARRLVDQSLALETDFTFGSTTTA
ncbi:4-hydroxyphenylacetate 3-hydroxylase family protein [Streptomyces sp. NPDC004726]